jgi:D-3-phosphoglycerate dehydrogenase/(S)-sulfolactate dehydrogenase
MAEIACLTSGVWLGESDHIVSKHDIVSRQTADTDVAIVGTQALDVDACKSLLGLVRLGVGYENVPADALREAGVVLAYTPNAPSQSVAEHALSLMLSALRLRATRCRPGRELSEITVAIIGLGRIGKRFAALLSALGVDIMAVDPVSDTTFDEIHHVARTDLDTALASADVVSLHVPVDDVTRDMIDDAALRRMKPDAVLVNTARGAIVSETAIFRHALAFPQFTAALDVFREEPYAGPLDHLPNVITTTHVASMTRPARRRMERAALEAAKAIIEDTEPRWTIPEREPWQD